jgi:cytochrome c biogenesis protein CcmG, thiol:disulfide interchange protein DsbE
MKRVSLLIVFTLLLTGCNGQKSGLSVVAGVVPDCSEIEQVTTEAKSLEMPCLDGSEIINFHAIRGPIVVNVWGSWCVGCREEMPYFIDLYANDYFKSGEIKLLGVDVQETTPQDGKDFIKSYGMSWPHLIDVEDNSKTLFGPGVPVTWFIDANGAVIDQKIGAYSNKEELFQQVEKAFKIKL